jgi:hypothetical protein
MLFSNAISCIDNIVSRNAASSTQRMKIPIRFIVKIQRSIKPIR